MPEASISMAAGVGGAPSTGDNWYVDRGEEAQRIADAIRAAGGAIVVLHGRRGSGKTKLVQREVIPRLRQDREVYYGECSPELPGQVWGPEGTVGWERAVERKAIVFLDGFDGFLALPASARREGLETLTSLPAAQLVVVVSEESLGELFALRSYLPGILENLLEVGELTWTEGLSSLAAAAKISHFSFAPEVSAALQEDLEGFPPKIRVSNGVLLQVVYDQAARLARGGVFGPQEYRAAGGLRGLLERHLNQQMEALHREEGPAAEVAARALLGEVITARSAGRAPEVAEVARRLDLAVGLCEKTLAGLAGPGGLLRKGWNGRLEPVPLQLEQILEEDLEQRRREGRRAEEILQSGLRSWQELGVLLPPDLFREVHGQRQDLAVRVEEAAFLVHVALRWSEQEPGVARYWLGRIGERERQITVLMEALFAERPDVRVQAARLLGEFVEPEVSGQLYRVALEDEDAAVREQAASSLEGMRDDALWNLLAREARQANSRFRSAAIETLRIFRDQRGVGLLGELVADAASVPEVRGKAIAALARIGTPAAVRRLVEIALEDEDEDDRQNAAEALSWSGSAELAPAILAALGGDTPEAKRHQRRWSWRAVAAWIGKAGLACVVLLLNLWVHGLALFTLRRWKLGALLLALEVAAQALPGWGGLLLLLTGVLSFALPARILLLERSQLRAQPGSFRGLVGIFAFAALALPVLAVFHGLAHALVKRWRVALQLLGLELLGVGFYLLYLQDPDDILGLGSYCLWCAGILFLGTWLWDLAVVTFQYILFPRRQVGRRRREAVYERVLENPQVAAVVLAAAASADPAEGKRARWLVKRFAHSIPAPLWRDLLQAHGHVLPRFAVQALQRSRQEETLRMLKGLWPEASRPMRSLLVRILAGDPSERSLEYLGQIGPQLGWLAKVRFGWGWLRFRVRLVPRTALLAGLILAPVLCGLAWEGAASRQDFSRFPVKVLRNSKTASREPHLTIQMAKFVAEVYPAKAPADVVKALGGVARDGYGAGQEAIDYLTLLAGREDSDMSDRARGELVNLTTVLAGQLKSGHVGNAIKALEVSRSDAAVEELKKYALNLQQPPPVYESEKAEKQRREREGLALEVIGTLRRMPNPTVGAALGELARDGKSPVIQREARQAQSEMRARLLDGVREAYRRGQYDQALRTGADLSPLLQGEADRARLAELLRLLGLASHHQAAAVAEKAEVLDRDAIQYLEQADRLSGLDQGARLNLVLSYERSAERLLATKPAEALPLVIRALQLDPNYPAAHATKGLIYRAQNRAEDALRSLAEASRLDPNYAWAWGNQCDIEWKRKNYARALELAVKTIEADPSYSWGYTLLAGSYHDQQKDREAIAHLEELRKKHPESPWPAQSEMYVYHEYLSAVDPAAYQSNYKLYEEYAKQFADRIPDPNGFEAGFLEAHLTTGRYPELIRRGDALLRSPQKPQVGVPARLLLYAAAVLQRDVRSGRARLEALETTLGGLSEGQKPEWSYEGTLRYIQRADVPADSKKALTDLIKAVSATPATVPPPVLEENRRLVKPWWRPF